MLSVQVFGPGGRDRNTAPEYFGLMGVALGRCEGATAEKAVPFPSEARRSLIAPSFRCAVVAVAPPALPRGPFLFPLRWCGSTPTHLFLGTQSGLRAEKKR